jgi:hypothetical protein
MWFDASPDLLHHTQSADWILQHYELPVLPPEPREDIPVFAKSCGLVKWLHLMDNNYHIPTRESSFPDLRVEASRMSFDDSELDAHSRYDKELHSLYNRAYVEYAVWHLMQWISTLTALPHQLRFHRATLGNQQNHIQPIQAIEWYYYERIIHAYPALFHVSPTTQRALDRECHQQDPADPEEGEIVESVVESPRVGHKRDWEAAMEEEDDPWLQLFETEEDLFDPTPAVCRRLSQLPISRPEDSTHDDAQDGTNEENASTGNWIHWRLTRLQRAAQLGSHPLHIAHMPVLRLEVERADCTLSDWLLLPRQGSVDDDVLQSILFQLIFALASYQAAFDFLHGDLHSGNIMLVRCDEPHGWYEIDDHWFRVPRYGWRVVLVDFGRSCFRWRQRWVASDDYSQTRKGEAAGQWNLDPFYTPNEPLVGYNRSFDLARLFNELQTQMDDVLQRHFPRMLDLVERWLVDDFGGSFRRADNPRLRFPGFRLYRYLARHVHGLVPRQVLLCEKTFLAWQCPRPDAAVSVASLSEIKHACKSWTDTPPTYTPGAPIAARPCSTATPPGSTKCSTDRSTNSCSPPPTSSPACTKTSCSSGCGNSTSTLYTASIRSLWSISSPSSESTDSGASNTAASTPARKSVASCATTTDSAA